MSFLPPPLPPPSFSSRFLLLQAGLLPLSFLAQTEGTSAKWSKRALGAVLLAVAARLMGGVDWSGDESKILLNYPLGLALFPLALTIPRLALPSTPFVHTQPDSIPSTTIDLLINVTMLGWKAHYSTRRKGAKSALEHFLVGLRSLGLIGVVLGVFVGLYPIWEAYERGEWEVGVEVGVGAAAGLMAYLIVETGFHLVAALFVGVLGWERRWFPEVMDRPWRADSIHDFWSHRWHPLLTPIFTFYSHPLPSYLRPPFIFLLSALFHEWGLFATLPYLPRPFCNSTRDFRYIHTFSGFFALQIVPFMLERLFKKVTGGRRVGGLAGWVWCWSWLLGGGRWVVRGLRDSGVIGFGAFIVQQWWASKTSTSSSSSITASSSNLGWENWTLGSAAATYWRNGYGS
ncbi:hypothetical protein BDY24DRAFT_445351 [Mrakia frigida]|uniref:uncharacterized protein n=1 Tax=Mrakia frigida TaxID=29902 RepID=UPI003FCC23F1